MSNYNRGGYSSSQGQGFVQDSFGNDATAPKRSYIHTLRPVTIKQILGATQTQADGDFKIDGQDIGQVTLIAAVRNINQASTQNIYMIEDGTGVIDAKRYPSDHDDPDEANSILLNTYARIVGTVKFFNQKQYIQVHSIRPVTSMNEVTYHNLEVLTVHVSATRSKVGGHGASPSSGAFGQHHNMHGVTSTDTHMRGGNDDVANSISDFIDNHPGKASGVGAHRRDIIAAFAQRLGGEHKVNEMLKSMEEDGHLYLTEDDDHFNTTH